jgi:hypothetical protein
MFAQQVLASYGGVIAGSQAFTSGSGTFVVPHYNTLTVNVWGAGASGNYEDGTTGVFQVGNPGGTSSVSTLSISATGGSASFVAGDATGGTGSGGNTTNSTGTAGSISGFTSIGGGAANGGGNVTITGGTDASQNGVPGTARGGGGTSGVGVGTPEAGGGGGGFSQSVYTFGVTSGAPAPGASLSWAVGAGGASTTAEGVLSGAGHNGEVQFIWR